jgi:hypothetical protein
VQYRRTSTEISRKCRRLQQVLSKENKKIFLRVLKVCTHLVSTLLFTLFFHQSHSLPCLLKLAKENKKRQHTASHLGNCGLSTDFQTQRSPGYYHLCIANISEVLKCFNNVPKIVKCLNV